MTEVRCGEPGCTTTTTNPWTTSEHAHSHATNGKEKCACRMGCILWFGTPSPRTTHYEKVHGCNWKQALDQLKLPKSYPGRLRVANG